MNILQFLRIFWARRRVILAATVSCLIGAMIVVIVIPPEWKASSRVMVDLGKTDVVTGEADPNSARGAVETQLAMATDPTVAGRVIDDLNLTSDPGLIESFAKKSSSDHRDFRHWLQDLIINNTKAKLLLDSAIIEISYTSANPDQAKRISDAVRDGFVQTNLDIRRKTAQENADWLEARSVEAKGELDKAVAAETEYERANGLAVTHEGEVDTTRLAAMSNEGAQGTVPPPAMLSSSSAAIELASVDAQIAAQSKQLGPNNPLIVQLKSQKTNLEATVAKEQAAQKMLAGIAASNSEVLAKQIAAQKAKVVGESDKIGKLSQLAAQVELRRDVFNKSSSLAAQQREQALTINAGLTPLGTASVPKDPAFPNPWLIYPGALVIGLAIGVLTALLMELLARRVRGVEDLTLGIDVPVLGLIAGPPRARRGFALRGPSRFTLPRGRKAAHA
jgi:succinoglycan biosynthesis transport protein ExoP